MPSMIELIRGSAVPANVVRLAAKGALSLPPGEVLEILVYLASHNKLFGEQAALTLAAWDEASCRAAAGNPDSPKEVLDYFLDSRNFRQALLPALLENESVSEESLVQLVTTAANERLETVLLSERIGHSHKLLASLRANANLTAEQGAKVDAKLAVSLGAVSSKSTAGLGVNAPQPLLNRVNLPGIADVDVAQTVIDADADVTAFLKEHAKEIAAEPEKPFAAIGGIYEETEIVPEVSQAEASGQVAALPASDAVPQPAPGTTRKIGTAGQEERGSTLQKIGRLGITGRIQLAMKGTKEERSLLIRDGTKIVALAVLDSPKISDGEVEKFASQKNVLEAVLRTIPMKRRFIKNYTVVRNLVSNPRTPIDVSLGLMKNLLVNDLKVLSGNKEVSETIRKLALRQYKQKSEKKP